MIQLSPRGSVIYQLLNLTVLLLLVFGLSLALSAVMRLQAEASGIAIDPAIPRFSQHAFTLLLVTSLISAGIAMADDALSANAIRRSLQVWRVLALMTLLASPFIAAELLDAGLALALLIGLAGSARSLPGTSFTRLWQIGAFLLALSLIAPQFAPEMAAQALRVHVAYPLCALCLAFWLMPRLSSLTRQSAEASLGIAAAFLCLAGGLFVVGQLDLPDIFAALALPLVVISTILVANHMARALRLGNENQSLARHWLALATLCWLASGLLSALRMPAGVNPALHGADLAAAHDWLAQCMALAAALAFVNETATSLRGDNRRVTGYAPLWLVSFGIGFSFIAQLSRGVAQLALRNDAVTATLSEAQLLLPITLIWFVFQLMVAAGMVAYALAYFLRLARIRVIER